MIKVLAYLLLSLPRLTLAAEPPEPIKTAQPSQEVADQIGRLAPDKPKDVRLQAIKQLSELAKGNAGTLKALPALGQCMDAADPVIRGAAVNALVLIAMHHKQPTPLPVVRALLDRDPDVRSIVWSSLSVFDRFDRPEEAKVLFLRALEHKDHEVRSAATLPLASFGKKPEVLIALTKALQDKHIFVRNNAAVALWKLTEDLELVLPWWLSFLDHSPVTDRKDVANEEKAGARIVTMAVEIRLVSLSKDRPAELSRQLVKNLGNPSPIIRKAAAQAIGISIKESKEVTNLLKELGAQAALRKLLDDPDMGVQEAARKALGKIEE